jgi:hypothetical protein
MYGDNIPVSSFLIAYLSTAMKHGKDMRDPSGHPRDPNGSQGDPGADVCDGRKVSRCLPIAIRF